MITPLSLDVNDVVIDISGVRIVSHGVLSAEPGTVVGLIGPNGCGKSTLLRTVYRALKPRGGIVHIGAADVWSIGAREAAQLSAVMLQDDSPEFEFTVREVVQLGRVPHQRAFRTATADDDTAVQNALDRCGTAALADRLISTLSGGERQRVYLARALAQQTPLIILDEPTNHLDVRAQLELLEILADIPATVVMAIHDLSLAAASCDELYLMKGGRLIAHGQVNDVLDPKLLEHVYGVTSALGTNPLTGRTTVHFGQPHTATLPS